MAFISLSIGLGSCSKSDDDNDSNSSGCGNGVNFCMTYDGTSKSGTATLRVISSTRYRVSWERSSGGTYEQVELDVYSDAAGNFAVDTTRALGTAAFEYFSTNPNALEQGLSGTVNVSSFDAASGASGTFSLTTVNGVKITGGSFTNVAP